MRIDIVSDTACPWCFIGKRRLAKALAQRPEIAFDVHWRPFRLDPTIPTGGVDRKAYIAKKFPGADLRAMAANVSNEGLREGIDFQFEMMTRTANTLDSHRVIHWAGEAGVQDKVVELIFSAQFEHGRDIGDAAVLAELAAQAGMDGGFVAERLASNIDSAWIEREDAAAHSLGVSGVPTFIFYGRFGLSGAREPADLVRVIDKAQAEGPADDLIY